LLAFGSFTNYLWIGSSQTIPRSKAVLGPLNPVF
jgi:hypothetical protein